MRQARAPQRFDQHYLLTNRMTGTRSFGEQEHEAFHRLVGELATLFTLKVQRIAIDRSTFYIVVKTPKQEATEKQTRKRLKAYAATTEDTQLTADDWASWQPSLHDISVFMRLLQRRFTIWYNQTRKTRRKGSLWADRYTSVELASL